MLFLLTNGLLGTRAGTGATGVEGKRRPSRSAGRPGGQMEFGSLHSLQHTQLQKEDIEN
jgi:hypothetical protein